VLSILYLILCAGFMALVWQLSKLNKNSYVWVLIFVLVGLLYDTLIIGIGKFLGEGEVLKTLNAGRFYVHALLTPTMIIFGFGVLRKAGVKWAQSRIAHIIVCSFSTLLILLGAYSDMVQLDLQSKVVAGTLRYINEGGIKGPPVPAILTIIFLIVAGITIWRNTGWMWLAIGAIFMFIAAGLGMDTMFYVGNIGELALSFANVATAKKYLS